jgi:hypothetical protein
MTDVVLEEIVAGLAKLFVLVYHGCSGCVSPLLLLFTLCDLD